MRVLVVEAHPDDIEFHCAGTLAKMAARGDEIFICIMTNGNIGSFTMSKEQTAQTRRGEAQRACDVIGAQLLWMDEDDEFLFDNERTRKKLIDAYRVARPDIVLANPAWADYNQDHDIAGYLAFVARVLATVKLIETEHESTGKVPPLFFYRPTGFNARFRPEYFVDITDFRDTKHEMLSKHESQLGDWLKNAFGMESHEFVDTNDKYWASICATPGTDYVEPFMLCKTWPAVAGAYQLLP